jgi:hypothetical protein
MTTGTVNEEIFHPAPQSERSPLLSQFSYFFSSFLDSLSAFFLCSSLSSLTHLVSSWCSRLFT